MMAANHIVNPLFSPDINRINLENNGINSDIRETSPDPDCISIVSDYSEMGFQIKRSIRFNNVTMSTYADLKNPDKSVTKLTVEDANNDENDLRKYNMLSLAMEFARWKEHHVDSGLGDSISDEPSSSNAIVSGSGSIWSVEDDNSNALAAEKSSLNLQLTSSLTASGTPDILIPTQHEYTTESESNFHDNDEDEDDSPLRAHTDLKFQNNFCTSTTTTPPDDDEDENNQKILSKNANEKENVKSGESEVTHNEEDGRKKKSIPVWAQILRQKQVLEKMPMAVQKRVSEIPKFNLNSPKFLSLFNINELQIVINCLYSQIEELNETLMMNLFIRDDLRSQQMDLVNSVEMLTMTTNEESHKFYNNSNCSTHSFTNSQHHNRGNIKSTIHTHPQPSYMHRFFSSLWNSPKSATNKVISYFNPNIHSSNSYQLPKPEYV